MWVRNEGNLLDLGENTRPSGLYSEAGAKAPGQMESATARKSNTMPHLLLGLGKRPKTLARETIQAEGNSTEENKPHVTDPVKNQ